MDNHATTDSIDLPRLKRKVAARYLLAVFVLAALFFLPSGTLDYWQAWAYMAILLLPMGAVLLHFLKKDPGFIERRLRMKEKQWKQRTLMLASLPVFFAVFLLPGLDRRFGWSRVPVWLSLVADFIVLAGYLLFVRVMRENRFLSRVVEVVPGQKLVSTGPYAVIRHPMYAAVIPLYLFSPLALGSFWALLPASLLPLVILLRIGNEEHVLSHELDGYRKYARRVKYRLIPKVW